MASPKPGKRIYQKSLKPQTTKQAVQLRIRRMAPGLAMSKVEIPGEPCAICGKRICKTNH